MMPTTTTVAVRQENAAAGPERPLAASTCPTGTAAVDDDLDDSVFVGLRINLKSVCRGIVGHGFMQLSPQVRHLLREGQLEINVDRRGRCF